MNHRPHASLMIRAALLGVVGLAGQTHSWATDANAPLDDYLDLPLADLLALEVSSVSKRMQKLREAAAATHVITREDIRRSGVTSIAEALRMAPGLNVARINGNKWAISSGGFNSQWSNKLLVLMDGRSIYSPTYSGVYWEMQDTLLADIERIEVIRGPGATRNPAMPPRAFISVFPVGPVTKRRCRHWNDARPWIGKFTSATSARPEMRSRIAS